MRAMILAAGLGKRMQPLTLALPKPLLCVGGDPLIVHHIKKLKEANIVEIVINLGHLGYKIEEALGDGKSFGVQIKYSYEESLLDCGGAIYKARDLLGPDPFAVISADIFTDYPFVKLPKEPKGLLHLVLTDNPPHHPNGDFFLSGEEVFNEGKNLLNFAGISVFRPELLQDCPNGAFPFKILSDKAFSRRQVTGEHYRGLWHNIGTPEQLLAVNNLVDSK